ncbi:MAG: histidine kinase dimerization/phosphoacceptor domain -containing protein [Methanobacteriaceae archaeon]|nr:histidine kinase dimerization/phosphoacceptor domain -containing protein [Methanobacteriaceae archaeon]
MYTLTFENNNKIKNTSLKLNNLNEIFKKIPLAEKIEKYNLADVLNELKYGLNILKPYKDDFIFLYSNKIFWDDFQLNLHEYLIGREFGKTLPKFINLTDKNLLKQLYENNKKLESTLKLYENEKLIKVWKQIILKEKDLLLIHFEDLTNQYYQKEREEKVFNEVSFPKLQINPEGTVLKINPAFTEIIGYTLTDLNLIKFENLIKSYKSHINMNNFKEDLNLIFNKKINTTHSKIKINKNNSEDCSFDCYIRLISNGIVQIDFYNILDYADKSYDWNLFEYFMDLNKSSKSAISLEVGDYVKLSPEIYDILEIEPSNNEEITENIVYQYLLLGEEAKLDKVLENLKTNEAAECVYNIESGKGNIKFLRTIFKLKEENNQKMIIACTEDLTGAIKAQKDAIRLKNNFTFIQDSSNIVLMEYENDKYTYTSQIYKILDIEPDDYPNTLNSLYEFIVPEDQANYKNSFNLSPNNNLIELTIKIRTKLNIIKYIHCQNKADFDDNGKITRIVSIIMDVTDDTLSKKSAIELENNLKFIQEFSKTVIGKYQDGFLSFTDEVYNILEIEPDPKLNGKDIVKKYVLPEDNKIFREKLNGLSPSSNSFEIYTNIKTEKGNIKTLHSYFKADFNERGDLVNIVGLMQDVTKEVKREEEFKELFEERKILLQEVHHRVKNNLQLILSFLNLESRFNSSNPTYVLNQARNRIKTMALTHEEVYNSPSVSKVNMKSFITQSMNDLFGLYTDGFISLNFDIDPIELSMDISIPLGLLINELALNTIKYAFPNKKEGNFYLSLKQIGDEVILKVWDNGVGLASDIDIYTIDSLGFIIVRNFTKQLEGELKQLNNVLGFGVEIKFNILTNKC